MVAATVVAPWPRRAMIDGRSRTLTFTTRRVAGQQLEVVGRQPDLRHAAEHRDGRRHRTVLADDALDLGRHRDVLRVGHAVADDRALQRDHRAVRPRPPRPPRPSARSRGHPVAQVGDDGVRAGHGECGRLVAVRRGVGQRRPLHQPVAERRQHRVAGSGHVHRRRGRRLELHHAVGGAEQRAGRAAAYPHHLDAAVVQAPPTEPRAASSSSLGVIA